jgi:RNA polymerase sigma factor (TIGR02999 family)
MAESSADISQLLQRWKQGDRAAEGALFAAVYPMLREVAARSRRLDGSLTLQTTELVNEAYMRLLPQQRVDWQNRAHFCAISAHVMRRLISNHIRDRQAHKRGGPAAQRVDGDVLERLVGDDEQRLLEWLSLDDALDALDRIDPQAARTVELRHIAGLDAEQSAEALGVSLATEGRLWRFARTFLEMRLGGPA